MRPYGELPRHIAAAGAGRGRGGLGRQGFAGPGGRESPRLGGWGNGLGGGGQGPAAALRTEPPGVDPPQALAAAVRAIAVRTIAVRAIAARTTAVRTAAARTTAVRTIAVRHGASPPAVCARRPRTGRRRGGLPVDHRAPWPAAAPRRGAAESAPPARIRPCSRASPCTTPTATSAPGPRAAGASDHPQCLLGPLGDRADRVLERGQLGHDAMGAQLGVGAQPGQIDP